jgi:hypothetical protein
MDEQKWKSTCSGSLTFLVKCNYRQYSLDLKYDLDTKQQSPQWKSLCLSYPKKSLIIFKEHVDHFVDCDDVHHELVPPGQNVIQQQYTYYGIQWNFPRYREITTG